MGANLSARAKERIAAARKTPSDSGDVNLSECELRVFPKPLLKLPFALKRLSLARNLLRVVPPSIAQLGTLEALDLSYNELVAVAQEVAALPHLRELSVAGNTDLGFLPDFPRLAALDVGGTNIGPLPAHMRLRSLQSLGACGMRLDAVPPTVLLLTGLRVLRLANNRLRTLPGDVARLASLEVLDVSANPIAALPPAVGDLAQLTHLNLAQTELPSLPAELGRLERLVVLDIRSSFVEVFDVPFERMGALRELLASSGRLRRFGPAAANSFSALQRLELLQLDHNRLEELPKEVGYLAALRKLELQHNNLSVLPGEIGFLNRAIELNLDGNPLKHPFGTLLQDGGVLALLENVAPYCSAHAAHCEIDRSKLDAVKSGAPCEFRVIAKDFMGRPRQTGKEPFILRIVHADGPNAGQPTESFIHDNYDKKDDVGTYDCYFNLPEPGSYEISVTIDGRNVQGSPFTVLAS